MSASPTLPAGFRLHAHDRLTSTSDEAKRLADAGEPHGAVVWARVQTEGRGRRGRGWTSPEGNLYVSYLLRPTVRADRATQAGFAAALAVADAVAAFLPPATEIRCKWPNDILVDGGKVAGLLLESALSAGGGLEWLVVGCGVNRVSHPVEARWPATDLEARGARQVPLEALLSALTERLSHWFGVWQRAGFAPVRDEWQARSYGIGRDIVIEAPDGRVRGRFVGLAEDGGLIVETPAGQRAFRHGDVSVLQD